jgi:hypothetical protein
MTGSIGQIAEQIVNEVRQNALIKVAQHEVVKEASKRPNPKTDIGKLLYKAAAELRREGNDVTVADVQNFLAEVGHAG